MANVLPVELGPYTFPIFATGRGVPSDLTAHFVRSSDRVYTEGGYEMAVAIYSNTGAEATPMYNYGFGAITNNASGVVLISSVMDGVGRIIALGLARSYFKSGGEILPVFPPLPGKDIPASVGWPLSDELASDPVFQRLRGSFASVGMVKKADVPTTIQTMPQYG